MPSYILFPVRVSYNSYGVVFITLYAWDIWGADLVVPARVQKSATTLCHEMLSMVYVTPLYYAPPPSLPCPITLASR